MSQDALDGVKIYTTGEQLPAEDVNTANEHIIMSAFKTLIAGENITKGDALYVKASDGKLYKTDGNAGNAGDTVFVGFALETITTGNLIDIQCTGVFEKLSGLTIGSYYFLSDTAGAITTTPSTTRGVQVGVALTANHLLIDRALRFRIVTSTYDVSTASGTQNIAHGLGRIPRKVKVTFAIQGSSSAIIQGWGVWTNTGQFCIVNDKNHTANAYGESSYPSNIIAGSFNNVGDTASAVLTVDGTNLILTWTKAGTPTGTLDLILEIDA